MRQKVIASGASTGGLEEGFARKYALPAPGHGVPVDYAIHGGGFPIRIKGVESVIGVIVVSGLKQEHDHQVIAEVVWDFLKQASK